MAIINYLNKKIIRPYFETFNGLSREIWWLSLITLINRAGTMVIPFISVYLNEGLEFSKSQVGWIMTAFGLGSVVGSWLGGRLADKIGYYKVMVFSLFATGFAFVGLQFLTTFNEFCIGIFIVMLIADMFRPAMFVAMNTYSKPENKTRSVTLIRLAINLGFSAGPAVGGLIIAGIGYKGLFWVDGITCVAAAFLLLKVLNPKKARELDNLHVENPVAAYKDGSFIIFLFAMMLFGFVFLQYFSTMPLYYREQSLSEFQIGLLMGMNGLTIAILEMPLIKKLQDDSKNIVRLMFIGASLVAASLWVLNFTSWVGILVVGMLLMTIGEMILFPFSNAFTIDRAKVGKQGDFMAWYSISFSMAHVFGHNAGMQLAAKVGFANTWNIMAGLGFLCALLLWYLYTKTRKRYDNKKA